jgi:flagellar protein FlaH
MRVEDLGTQLVKVMEVAKIRGANKTTGNVVSFDVEPNFGMKIIPITKAKA